MDYREQPPPTDLQPFVRCLWSLRGPACPEAPVEPVVPDGGVELIVHCGDPFVRHEHGRQRAQPRALFVGQITGPLTIAPTGAVDVVGVRFRLGGAAPFLHGRPLHELTERDVDVDDLWPGHGRRLADAVGTAPDVPTRWRRLAQFLRTQLRVLHHSPAIAAAERWLTARAPGRLHLDDLVAGIGLGSRQLQRLFADHIGLGPKRIARILRFQQLVAAVRGGADLPFAVLAQRCGYADQAHLVRDCREFTGLSPSQWLRRQTPIAAALAGLPLPADSRADGTANTG